MQLLLGQAKTYFVCIKLEQQNDYNQNVKLLYFLKNWRPWTKKNEIMLMQANQMCFPHKMLGGINQLPHPVRLMTQQQWA